MTCKLSDKCDNVFACNILRPNVELLGCNFYKPKKPMTNEEWFCGLSTEEKAKWLAGILFAYGEWTREDEIWIRSETWMKWLKEKHNGN